MELTTRVNIFRSMRMMKVGDTFSLPADIYKGNSVRNIASRMALDYNRTLSVHLDRASMCYIITRKA